MKNIILGCMASLAIVSCSSNSNKTAGTDTVIAGDTLAKAKSTEQTNNTATVTSLCFLHTDGTKKQDSTSVELVIKGSEVTGLMNWLPSQKDSRKGKLNGSIKGDTIQAKWTFMQEGMEDTIGVNFRLIDDQLAQKPLKLNVKTGRQQTDEAEGYTVLFNSSDKLKTK